MVRLENEWQRSRTIIVDYKQICNDMSVRLEQQQKDMERMQGKVLVSGDVDVHSHECRRP